MRFLPFLTVAVGWSQKSLCDLVAAPPTRDVFYVGGEYVNLTVGDTTTHVMVNQIYVEKLTPARVTQKYPIIFIAGAGQTGTNFLDTPDGRPGWSSFFLSQGYIVYLSDQTNRGRSPWQPSIGSMITFDVPAVENYFTDPSEQKLWPQAHLHNQWPGTGRVGDPYFDAVFASQIQFQLDFVVSDRTNQKAYSALLDKIGASYLITHSQAGTYGWLVGDARPDLVKGIVALEPSGPPFQNEPPFGGGLARPWGVTVTEIQYEPSAGPNATHLSTIVLPPVDSEHTQCIMQAEPAKKLKNLANIPVLIVSGEASFHAAYGQCTVNYLKQAGVDVDYADLGEQGIHGNGHFFFMEKNNLVIAKKVLRWLKDH